MNPHEDWQHNPPSPLISPTGQLLISAAKSLLAKGFEPVKPDNGTTHQGGFWDSDRDENATASRSGGRG